MTISRTGHEYRVHREREGKHWLEYGVAIVLILTFLGAAYQARYAGQSARIAADQDYRQSRAYVAFIGASLVNIFNASGILEINFEIKNFGLTPASKLILSYSTIFLPDDLFDSQDRLITQVDIPDGEYQRSVSQAILYQTIDIKPTVDAGPLTQDQLIQFNAGSAEIVWYGTISYVDAFNHSQETDFCVMFNNFPDSMRLQRNIMCANHGDAS